MCVKLYDDKIGFEASDFEYLVTHFTPEMLNFFGDRPGKRFKNIPQLFAKQYTKSVNRRLSYFFQGKKSKNTKKWAILVFDCLWRKGIPQEQFEPFRWVSRSEIFKQLQRVGRPKNEERLNQLERDTSRLHYTALERVLKGMVDAELIESKKSIVNKENMPNKKKQNWFYRISRKTIDEAVTPQEQIEKLETQLNNLRELKMITIIKTLAILKIAEDKGIHITGDEIDDYVNQYSRGEREL
jgi:hypothetical protein